MKQHHYCKSIKNQNNEDFTCNHIIVPPRPMTRCNGLCFQKNFYQQKQHQYPSYIYHPIPHMIVQPWPIMPLTCNHPSFTYPYHEPCYFKKIKTKQKILDPCSHRATVRRITPLYVAIAASEAYRTHRNNDSDKIHLEPFNKIIMSPHQKIRTIQTTNLYERDYINSNNQNIPSVPSKKIVYKNNGLQVSSTSFILTTDDPESFLNDNLSKKSSECYIIRARKFNKFSFSMTEVEKSNNDTFALSRPNSALSTINVINPMAISRSEDTTTTKNVDNISIKSLVTKQIESTLNNVVEEHSSVNPQPTIDKADGYEKHSNKEEFNPLEPSNHDMANGLDINIPESTIKSSSIDISHPPTLPSSLPPNIDNIKSNEMLINSSRSVRSITSLINARHKSSTDLPNSSSSLRTTRSTLNFGLLIHETITEDF